MWDPIKVGKNYTGELLKFSFNLSNKQVIKISTCKRRLNDPQYNEDEETVCFLSLKAKRNSHWKIYKKKWFYLNSV